MLSTHLLHVIYKILLLSVFVAHLLLDCLIVLLVKVGLCSHLTFIIVLHDSHLTPHLMQLAGQRLHPLTLTRHLVPQTIQLLLPLLDQLNLQVNGGL